MSLLGIDVGTTGCKAVVFRRSGETLASAYREYDIVRGIEGRAELDARAVWELVCEAIAESASMAAGDPIEALCVTSMGEAAVPVTRDRSILGPSILIIDERGAEYVPSLRARVDDRSWYALNGNRPGNQFGLTKLMWLRDHEPRLYATADFFLNWSGFVSFMLGAEPSVDFSLANRMLLFDIETQSWSESLAAAAGIALEKLPRCVAAGTVIGEVASAAAGTVGVPPGTPIVAGCHDQCASALGCGIVEDDSALFGMGTFPTIAPVFSKLRNASAMLECGLNTEHHAVPGRYLTFIYNMGGAAVKWYRDLFAVHGDERDPAYAELFAELPDGPSRLLVVPHLAPSGPPDFVDDASGVIVGLTVTTRRAEVLQAILEANLFDLKISVDNLDRVGVSIRELRAAGGGSHSDGGLRMTANILNAPVSRSDVAEAGCLGAALLAGVGIGRYAGHAAAIEEAVRIGATFEPEPALVAAYRKSYDAFREFRDGVLGFSRRWNAAVRGRG